MKEGSILRNVQYAIYVFLLTLDHSKCEFNTSQFVVRIRLSIKSSSWFVASYHQVVKDSKVWYVQSDAFHVIVIGQKGTSTGLTFREVGTEGISIGFNDRANIIFTVNGEIISGQMKIKCNQFYHDPKPLRQGTSRGNGSCFSKSSLKTKSAGKSEMIWEWTSMVIVPGRWISSGLVLSRNCIGASSYPAIRIQVGTVIVQIELKNVTYHTDELLWPILLEQKLRSRRKEPW